MLTDLIFVVATGLWPVVRQFQRDCAQSNGYSIQRRNASGTLSTRRALLRDFDCQIQCRCGLRTGNARLASGARGFDERCELQPEWFLMFYADSVTPTLFSNAPIDFTALILIIEREISVFLKNPNL